MTHSLSSAQHAFQHLDAQQAASVENVGPDVGQHLASLLDSLPEALVYLDRQGHVMYLNQQAERLLQ